MDGVVPEKGKLKGERVGGALGNRGCWGSWKPRENSDAKRKTEPWPLDPHGPWTRAFSGGWWSWFQRKGEERNCRRPAQRLHQGPAEKEEPRNPEGAERRGRGRGCSEVEVTACDLHGMQSLRRTQRGGSELTEGVGGGKNRKGRDLWDQGN